MDTNAFISMLSTFGFPTAAAVILGWFCYNMVHKYIDNTNRLLEMVQQTSEKREDRLLKELETAHEVSENAMTIIASYTEKLETIQKDVSVIKDDIRVVLRERKQFLLIIYKEEEGSLRTSLFCISKKT